MYATRLVRSTHLPFLADSDRFKPVTEKLEDKGNVIPVHWPLRSNATRVIVHRSNFIEVPAYTIKVTNVRFIPLSQQD